MDRSSELQEIHQQYQPAAGAEVRDRWEDRKSTRLNSSHLVISYAVFCLKKKKKFTPPPSQHVTQPPILSFTSPCHGLKSIILLTSYSTSQIVAGDAYLLSTQYFLYTYHS